MKLYEKNQSGRNFKDKELYDFFREETQNEEMETLIQKMFDYISKNIFSNYNNEEYSTLLSKETPKIGQNRGQGGAIGSRLSQMKIMSGFL